MQDMVSNWACELPRTEGTGQFIMKARRDSRVGWQQHADGVGQDAKHTSWQASCARNSCLFQELLTNQAVPIPEGVAEPGCKFISDWGFALIPPPFSCSWTLPSCTGPSFFVSKRILWPRLWSVLTLPCGMTFIKGRMCRLLCAISS